jgi:hypothetical protein
MFIYHATNQNLYHTVRFLFIDVLYGCKKKYNAPALQNNPGLPVVDGTFTDTPDSTFITLTRSRNIADAALSPDETNATLILAFLSA